MPSLASYKHMLGSHKNGEVRKIQSDDIMDATWWEDINSRVAYLCDWYHDNEPLKLNNMNPKNDPLKIPIDVKYLQSSSQTYDKDQVTFHIQLRPKQECNVSYYKEYFEDRYSSMFPIGLYAIIQDEKGMWNRWLIVDKANINVTQFPTFEILRCDYVFQYIIDNTKYQIPGVLRSQNSYNSGIWSDYRITSVEDQQKFAIPLNRDTEKIWYTANGNNLRLIIDGKVTTEPRCWKVTKVNRISPNGIARITMAQDLFNEHTDYVELDNNGNVIGMWADYYSDNILPEDFKPNPTQKIYSILTYSGLKPEIKSGGSYKKITIKFYDNNNEEIQLINGEWIFTVDSKDAIQEGLISVLYSKDSSDVDDNQVKVKFNKNDLYIGKLLNINYTSVNGVSSNIELEIVGL